MYLQQRFLRSMNDIRIGDTIARVDNPVGGTNSWFQLPLDIKHIKQNTYEELIFLKCQLRQLALVMYLLCKSHCKLKCEVHMVGNPFPVNCPISLALFEITITTYLPYVISYRKIVQLRRSSFKPLFSVGHFNLSATFFLQYNTKGSHEYSASYGHVGIIRNK